MRAARLFWRINYLVVHNKSCQFAGALTVTISKYLADVSISCVKVASLVPRHVDTLAVPRGTNR
jgi:hypothetical protein